jgi:tetratricopeptide (TPR) repeat protein
MAEGEFALIHNHLEAALRQLPALTRWGSAASDLDLLVLYAEYAVEQSLPDQAERARRALVAAVAVGHHLYEGIAQRALGQAHLRAGDWDEAETCLAQALELFQAVPAPWQAARTLVATASVAQARAQPDRARSLLQLALSEFLALGAAPDVERARAALAQL